jgi:hypothetical protein
MCCLFHETTSRIVYEKDPVERTARKGRCAKTVNREAQKKTAADNIPLSHKLKLKTEKGGCLYIRLFLRKGKQ